MLLQQSVDKHLINMALAFPLHWLSCLLCLLVKGCEVSQGLPFDETP